MLRVKRSVWALPQVHVPCGFHTRHYQQFKHHFQSKNEKVPKPIQGLSGIYYLKRLSELI
ncbi:MAG: hypothetical protein LJE94_08815 [Deltaproteobacteria bacterium]|nr:hypothetical protein [Deltaproteobacteria bacterium]